VSDHRDRWLAEKRSELDRLGALRLTDIVPSRRDFTQFVATQKQGLALVPRLQRANPDSGGSWPGLDVADFARACDDAEAGALAVRTAAVFGASLADLDTVVAAVSAPVLRDDLCLDRLHIYQSRLHGADAVLLPATEGGAASVRELAAVASSVHMASVIEVGDEPTLRVALDIPTACIGLACAAERGRADLARVRALAAQVPRHRTVVLLAEVAALDDLLPLAGLIDAAVVGDALLGAADPAATLRAFLARAA
jgi:indole-3-glycerol phosphate synthase